MLAWDPGTTGQEAFAVDEVYERTADHLRIIEIDSGDGSDAVLKTTDEHPFWVEGQGWVNAGELEAGDRLREVTGQSALVVATSRESHTEGIAVFNPRVPGVHNYFAGEDGDEGYLVHNADYNAKRLREGAEGGLRKLQSALSDKTRLLQRSGERPGPKPKGQGPHNLKIIDEGKKLQDEGNRIIAEVALNRSD